MACTNPSTPAYGASNLASPEACRRRCLRLRPSRPSRPKGGHAVPRYRAGRPTWCLRRDRPGRCRWSGAHQRSNHQCKNKRRDILNLNFVQAVRGNGGIPLCDRESTRTVHVPVVRTLASGRDPYSVQEAGTLLGNRREDAGENSSRRIQKDSVLENATWALQLAYGGRRGCDLRAPVHAPTPTERGGAAVPCQWAWQHQLRLAGCSGVHSDRLAGTGLR